MAPPGVRLWYSAYRSTVDESQRLGRLIHRQLQTLYSLTNIIKMNSGPRSGRMAALRSLTMPGVVVELGNLSESNTAQYLGTEQTQRVVADSLAVGIADFIYEKAGLAVGGAIR